MRIADSVLALPLNPHNVREGEDHEFCLQHTIAKALRENPEYAAYMNSQENTPKDYNPEAKVDTWTIPVVFHLLHNNGIEKISREQILDQLDILNRDFNLQNSDASSVVWDFNASNSGATAIPTNVDIDFVLATIAPDGTCFDGITETVTSVATNASGESAIINAVKQGNNVCQNMDWYGTNGRYYLNIFITADLSYVSGAAAYTYTPGGGGNNMDNGIFTQHQYVGSIGTASPYVSRAITHEVGHWLNLEHTWGWGDVGDAGNCSGWGSDDGVDDTPDCKGLSSCQLGANSCNGDNAYWGYDIPDNTENYMDYSYCSKMFTPQQSTRMRNALSSTTGSRRSVHQSANLTLTGADGNLFLCKAEFEADQTSVCAGQTIQFTDLSYNGVSGWSWSFQGGTPATSTVQNPTVTYSTPGVYQVTLNATDGSNNDSETKVGYIRVQPNAISIPFLEDFESFATLNNIDEWEVYNPGNNAKFELNTTFGHTGSKCAKLINFGQPAGQTDELISAPVDLSVLQSTDVVTLSFRYAYVKRYASNDEWLKVFISPDCGTNWAQRKTIHGDLLSPIALNSSWAPSSIDDWTTIHMTNVTSNYYSGDFRYKFEFESDGGNNFYLDNINIYYGAPVDELAVGEISTEFTDVTLYPNPTDDEVNIRFNVMNDLKTTLVITDLSGKVVQERTVNALAGNNLVMMDTNELAPGMYFVTLNAGAASQTLQFVVK